MKTWNTPRVKELEMLGTRNNPGWGFDGGQNQDVTADGSGG